MSNNSHTNASNAYNKKTYQKFQANLKKADAEKINIFCSTNNISKSKIIVSMFNYCIEHIDEFIKYLATQNNFDDESGADDN